MPWVNFAHLTRTETDGIGIRGTGKQAESVGAPGRRLKPLAMETGSGGPVARMPDHVRHFIETRKRTVRRYRIDPELRLRPWFNRAIKNANGNIEAFVNEVAEHLAYGVNEQTITEAQRVLNEVSRTEAGAAAVRKVATKASLLRLINASKGRT